MSVDLDPQPEGMQNIDNFKLESTKVLPLWVKSPLLPTFCFIFLKISINVIHLNIYNSFLYIYIGNYECYHAEKLPV